MITFEQAQPYIFAGESGGDYNALFNYQNRKDGLFSDIKLTDMTLDEVLNFTNPRGAYANYVSANNKGTISTPVGAYQVVGKTLRQAKEDLNLSGDEKFSKSLQDKIGRYIFNTQGVDAWEGYKGPRGQKEIKSMALPNNQTMNMSSGMASPLMQNLGMQPQQKGLMPFLRDPRTRLALASLSRGQIGRNQLALANADMTRLRTKNIANRTAAYLRSQEGGEIFADGIDAGLDPKQMYEDWFKATKGDPDENYSLTPQIIVNEETGEKQLLQLGSGGNIKITKLPKGFKLNTKGYDKVDLGTKWGFMDKQTGDVVYTIDKNIAAEVEENVMAEEKSKEKVTAQGAIEKARVDTNAAFVLIDRIKEQRNVLPMILGSVRGVIPKEGIKGKVFNQQQIDLITDIDSLSGLVGTQAYQSLRGAGAITKDELQIAIEGLGNLTRVQSVDSFIRNLNALQQRLSDYLNIAERQAAQTIDVQIDSPVETQTQRVTPFNSNASTDTTQPEVNRVEID